MTYRHSITYFLAVFEKIPKSILIGLLLGICYFTLVPNSNEEQYLALAKQFGDPRWIPNSINLSEVPGSRLIYQLLFGFILKYLSIPSTVVIFRLILIWLFAVPMAKIYSALKLDNAAILIHLGVLFLAHQSLFAGSFIFLSVEPKCFSYVFVFWALFYLLNSRKLMTVVCLIAATYLHILVGVWAAIYIIGSLIFADKLLFKRLKDVIISYGTYAVAVLPFVFYLINSVNVSSEIQPSASWIYTYFRSPHHTALAPDISYFYQNHFYGILWTLVGFIFALDFIKQTTDSIALKLAHFSAFALGGSLLLVSLAFLDSEGIILKYYPYRIMSVASFGLFILLTIRITTLFGTASRQLAFYTFLAASAMLMEVIIPTWTGNMRLLANADKHLIAATQFIKENSEQDDVILDFTEDARTIRLTERNLFAAYKFIPADFDKVHDWYERVLASREMSSNPNLIPTHAEQNQIDFILSEVQIEGVENLEIAYQNREYWVYTIKNP